MTVSGSFQGFEVETGHDDKSWYWDEHGDHAREQKFASWREQQALETREAIPINDAYIASLEWDAEMDRMRTRTDWSVVAQFEDAARVAFEQVEAEARNGASRDGLVSVLSTGKRAKRVPRCDRKPAAAIASASTQAAVQAAGAFIAGGAEARMAKLRMAVGFAARVHCAPRKGHRPFEVRMLTLTYRDAKAWRPNQIKELMRHVRMWHERNGMKCRYVWVAELQDGKRRRDGVGRDAVHYHVALWVPVGAPLMPMPDKQGWWAHGWSRIESAKHAVSYLMHYLKKSNSKHFGSFPDGCRLYSVGGLEHADRRARRWLRLPAFVQGNSSIFDNWTRKVGGGWVSPDGEWFPSEFRRVSIGGCAALQRMHTHPRTIDASGPFNWIDSREVVQ